MKHASTTILRGVAKQAGRSATKAGRARIVNSFSNQLRKGRAAAGRKDLK